MNDTEDAPIMYRLAERVGKEFIFRGKIMDRSSMLNVIEGTPISRMNSYRVIAGTSEECLKFMLNRLNQDKRSNSISLHAFYHNTEGQIISEVKIRNLERSLIAEDVTGKQKYLNLGAEENTPGVYKHTINLNIDAEWYLEAMRYYTSWFTSSNEGGRKPRTT